MRPVQTRLIFVIRGVSSACVQSALGLAGSATTNNEHSIGQTVNTKDLG